MNGKQKNIKKNLIDFFKGSIKDKFKTSNVQFILDTDNCGWILLNADNKSVNLLNVQFIQDLHDVSFIYFTFFF